MRYGVTGSGVRRWAGSWGGYPLPAHQPARDPLPMGAAPAEAERTGDPPTPGGRSHPRAPQRMTAHHVGFPASGAPKRPPPSAPPPPGHQLSPETAANPTPQPPTPLLPSPLQPHGPRRSACRRGGYLAARARACEIGGEVSLRFSPRVPAPPRAAALSASPLRVAARCRRWQRRRGPEFGLRRGRPPSGHRSGGVWRRRRRMRGDDRCGAIAAVHGHAGGKQRSGSGLCGARSSGSGSIGSG